MHPSFRVICLSFFLFSTAEFALANPRGPVIDEGYSFESLFHEETRFNEHSDELDLDELESWIEQCPEEMLRDFAAEPSAEDLKKISDALKKFAKEQKALDAQGNVDPDKLGDAAIKAYDTNGDNVLNKEELKVFLSDYCIGNYFTRGSWADGLIDYGDENGDKKLSAKEISSAFKKSS